MSDLLGIRKARENAGMRAFLAGVPLLLAVVVMAGASPAAVGPPRLLGLSISNGGHPFRGDTRQLATISPNGDGYRDRAIVRFRLDRAARVLVQAVATDEVRRPVKVMWQTRLRLAAGPHSLPWTPPKGIASRTYLLRFTVKGLHGGRRVYGFERPRASRPTSGLVVRILSIEVTFVKRSYAQGAQAAVSISTDSPSVRIRFFSYPSDGLGNTRDPNTNAVPVTPSVRLDWRGHRDSPHVLQVARSGDWPGGLYFLRVTTADNQVGYAPVILRPKTIGEHRVAVVLSTNTWQAYNFRDATGDGWGDSWYIGGAAPAVDLRRPYLDSGLPYRFREWNAGFLSWLRQTGKEVDWLSDDDLDSVPSGDDLRRAYDLVVFPGHEEYVTGHVYDVISRFQDLGGNLIFLSANDFFWKVERRGAYLRRIDQWRRLDRPEARVIGIQWIASNYGESERSYVVTGADKEPWVFAGTGLANGSEFGRYGIEIDARSPSSPSSGVTVLAVAPHAIGKNDAEMALYRTTGGAMVFAAGALDFSGSIGLPAVARLVDNVWARLARP
jgi:hypothetical protein